MFRFTVRKAALLSAVLAAVAGPARAEDGCCSPPPCAPAMRTIYVTECVPQTYTTTRTVYRTECRTEPYTAYRCESVPEVRERVVTTYQRVAECRPEVRRYCVSVPCCEERTVMKPCWSTVTETVMRTRCVDRGHYECREVPVHRVSLHRRHHGDCCDPCPPPPCTRTVKVWVPCKVTECYPVTHCKRVCTMVPTVVKVNTCRQEWREQTVNVTHYRCVPVSHTVKYTCYTTRTVPYQATRTVSVCVPHQETVTCTRYVTRCVARQVPCDTCETTLCCSAPGRKHGGLLGGFRRHGHGSGCCD
jgi:hypothetical protein